ncbi:VapE domain-containing protein [Corynebacterium variabile]|uniref:VapE domain-containing protein n=1 Tax=Corynebacterium variabile TaxID=1727 RepID=UPI003FCFA3D8
MVTSAYTDRPVTPGGIIDWLDTLPVIEPTPVAAPVARTYADLDAAGVLDRTLGDLLPINNCLDKHKPICRGHLGGSAVPVTDDERTEWAGHVGNVAVHVNRNIVVIDVDGGHEGKTGFDTLADLESVYGPLPRTWMSSRRGSLHHGGQLWYRYPANIEPSLSSDETYGQIGENIDIIDWVHRYSLTSGSTCPVDSANYKASKEPGSTATWDPSMGFLTYCWYSPDGVPQEASPTADDLPELSWDFYQEVLKKPGSTFGNNAPGGFSSSADAEDFAAQMTTDDRPMCPKVRDALDRAVEAFETAGSGNHDAATFSGTMSIASVCSHGHSGFADAAAAFSDVCTAHYGSDRKYLDKMDRALRKVTAEQDGEYHPRQDPGHSCSGSVVLTDWDDILAATTDTTTEEAVIATDTTAMPPAPALPVPVPPAAALTPQQEAAAMLMDTTAADAVVAERVAATAARREEVFDRAVDTDGFEMDASDTTVTAETESDFPVGGQYGLRDHPSINPDIVDDDKKVRAALSTNKAGNVEDTFTNTATIVGNDRIIRHLGKNMDGQVIIWTKLPPWRATEDPDDNDRGITDDDIKFVRRRMCGYFGDKRAAFSDGEALDEMVAYASHPARKFSPLKAHIMSLPKWDGTPRIERPIAACEDTEYTRGAFYNIFLGMAKRILRAGPTCKVDTMLVLYGEPRTGKTLWATSIFEGISGVVSHTPINEIPEGGSTGATIRIMRHDAPIALYDEIDTLAPRVEDMNAMKSDLTWCVDKDRAPYDRKATRRNRHFVFIGTTNDREFLTSEVGNRRYQPVHITGKITDEERSRAWFDLLLAEARDRLLAGEDLLTDDAFEALADEAREAYQYNPVAEMLDKFFADPKHRITKVPFKTDQISRVNISWLMDNVDGLSAKRLQMSVRTIRRKVKAYMMANDDYEYRATLKNVPGYGYPVKVAWERRASAPSVGATVTKLNTGYYGVPTDAPCGFTPDPSVITRGPSTGLNTVSYDGPTPTTSPSQHAQQMTERIDRLGMYSRQTPPPPVPPTTPDPAA